MIVVYRMVMFFNKSDYTVEVSLSSRTTGNSSYYTIRPGGEESWSRTGEESMVVIRDGKRLTDFNIDHNGYVHCYNTYLTFLYHYGGDAKSRRDFKI
jgi:hypothetical protein